MGVSGDRGQGREEKGLGLKAGVFKTHPLRAEEDKMKREIQAGDHVTVSTRVGPVSPPAAPPKEAQLDHQTLGQASRLLTDVDVIGAVALASDGHDAAAAVGVHQLTSRHAHAGRVVRGLPPELRNG